MKTAPSNHSLTKQMKIKNNLMVAALAAANLLCFFTPARAGDSAAPLRDKTLVAWAAPANLTQRGGSVLTINDGRGHFDGVVFVELTPAKWMAGSDNWIRTERQQSAWPVETTAADTPVQIAMVYRGNEVAAYRNGKEYSRHVISEPQPFDFKSDRHRTAASREQ